MGKNGIPTELLVKFRSQSWCPGLRSDKDSNQPLINIFKESVVVPAIDDLLHIPHVLIQFLLYIYIYIFYTIDDQHAQKFYLILSCIY